MYLHGHRQKYLVRIWRSIIVRVFKKNYCPKQNHVHMYNIYRYTFTLKYMLDSTCEILLFHKSNNNENQSFESTRKRLVSLFLSREYMH